MQDWLRERVYSGRLDERLAGKDVVVAGWVQEIRNLGGIAFIQLRDREGTVQLTALKRENRELFKALTTLNRESVVAVRGLVQPNKEAPGGLEVLPGELDVLSPAAAPLPMGVVDKVGVELDTRLNARFIDLRRPGSAAVFRIRSSALRGIRSQFEQEGFVEVHTPKIVATATEGGTALFPVQYFEHRAFLNQSPQLFKQMLMATGFDRVYEIGPAFRAELHDTVRHLNEFTSIDIEMAFSDEEGAMGVLERCLQSAVKRVIEERPRELGALGLTLEVPSLPFPRLTYTKCIELANSKGIDVEWGADLEMDATKAVAEETEGFYFITRWPTAIKPFYAHPFEDKPRESRSFDLMFGEKEITSGAQRVHEPDLLVQRLRDQGLDPGSFDFYLQAFRFGMPPHAGWGLGAERTVMILTGRDNVRDCVLFPRDRRRLSP
ncbi:MAG: aspartate--tRNA(Asn) ligase [Euryarchaeota archaeon]|nr:aspartate--tRNA(Asn) ligase [Euryarchaeota archaeon]